MIDKILEVYHSSDYDFRAYANPEDPLKPLFSKWVPYYRMKYAIASVLQPQTILEIGVRYGYSAITFLQASPAARYLGIDLDTDQFGGVKGSIHWAKEITRSYQAEFLIADTQTMNRFPGEEYDLIHVDGQQDGLGTYQDLTLAMEQAVYILLDGFMWSEENYRSGCQFLHNRKRDIAYFASIPGYAGELLIRVSDHYRRMAQVVRRLECERQSETVREYYTADYYLKDCGGYDSYRHSGGKELLDRRLQAAFALASPRRGQHFLDLGCGRGELSYQAARKGAQVTAVDYSADSIQLAKACFSGEPELQSRVRFECANISEYDFKGAYDRVVAADLVEHLHPHELRKLCEGIARHLSHEGRFIIHTAPNAWFNRRGYASRRKKVAQQGVYLPRDPRTAYEKLMHLHEQTPASLKRILKEHFPHVLVWVSPDESSPEGSLARDYGYREYLEARDIFAVASHQPISKEELLELLCQQPLALQGDDMAARIDVIEPARHVHSGHHFQLKIQLTNLGKRVYSSQPPAPVHLSYHWARSENDSLNIFDGNRTRLPFPILPGETISLPVEVVAPEDAGRWTLRLTLVQEGVAWFDEYSPHLPKDVEVDVR